MDACSPPSSSSYIVDLSDSTNNPNKVIECLAKAGRNTLGSSLFNLCDLLIVQIVCDQCDCGSNEQSCQRMCILQFNHSRNYVYMVLTGLSANGFEAKTLLLQITSSGCLGQHGKNMLHFDDCSCTQTPTPTALPHVPESSNGKFFG